MVGAVCPNPKRDVGTEDGARLAIALITYEQAIDELRAAVRASPASVRAIADFLEMSPSTIQRWRTAPERDPLYPTPTRAPRASISPTVA